MSFLSLSSTLFSRSARLLAGAVLATAALTTNVRADLLVLNPGGGGGVLNRGSVLRYSADTGERLGEFGYDNEGFRSMFAPSRTELFVVADMMGQDLIYQFDTAGGYRGTVVNASAGGIARGPDGKLFLSMYDAAGQNPHVVRVEGTQATVFASAGAGMTAPKQLLFGPDGFLYVLDVEAGILRFNASTGLFRDVVVPAGRGGLQGARQMAFGPDGQLYVAHRGSNAILRFDSVSGAYLNDFVAAGSGGLTGAASLAFGPDGNLYVTSQGTSQVLRFDGTTGAFRDVFISDPALHFPTDLIFTAEPAPEAPRFTAASPSDGA